MTTREWNATERLALANALVRVGSVAMVHSEKGRQAAPVDLDDLGIIMEAAADWMGRFYKPSPIVKKGRKS